MRSLVELRVSNEGEEALVYTFAKVVEAAEMIRFLADFWPDAQFTVQPVRH